jgi:zinc transport system substrate-binding protein
MVMKIKYLIIIGIMILAVFLVGCQKGVTQNKDKLDVIVSILPQKAFVTAVGRDHINVNELIPPGGSPETYEPKPSDLANVEKADIYFRIGYIPFEKSHADKFAGLNPNMKIIDTSTNVELRYFGKHEEEHEDEESEEKHHHEGADPHIWLSPILVKKQIDTIAETFSEIDPDNSAEYMKNAEDFKKELDDLHNELELKFKELKTDKLMVFHPAWGYFTAEYGLVQIAIEQDGKEPTAEQLHHLIDEARKENIKVIFVQSQFNKGIAESIAEEIGAVVVSINPLSENYINNLKNVATTITEYLN